MNHAERLGVFLWGVATGLAIGILHLVWLRNQ